MNHEKDNELYPDEEEAQQVGNGATTVPPQTKAGNLVALVSSPKSRRVLIATGGAVLLVTAIAVVGITSATRPKASSLPASMVGVSVGQTPGRLDESSNTALAGSKEYQDIVAQASQSRASEAALSGNSLQPLAITVESALRPNQTPAELEVMAAKEAKENADRVVAQALAASMQEQQRLAAAVQQSQPSANQGQMDAMAQQTMQNALRAVTELTANRTRGGQVYAMHDTGSQQGQLATVVLSQGAAVPSYATASGAAPTQTNAVSQFTLISAGSIESARIDTAVNTDVGGSFAATLVTGKYAGAKLVGVVQRKGELAQLTCSLMSFPGQGVSIPATCVVLDAETGEGGTASEVDRKLFVKYGVKPLAAGFGAVAEYLKTSGTSVTINGTSTAVSQPEMTSKKTSQLVLGSAAAQLGSDAGGLDTTPTVRVHRGAIVGVFFPQDVTYTPKSR